VKDSHSCSPVCEGWCGVVERQGERDDGDDRKSVRGTRLGGSYFARFNEGVRKSQPTQFVVVVKININAATEDRSILSTLIDNRMPHPSQDTHHRNSPAHYVRSSCARHLRCPMVYTTFELPQIHVWYR